MMIEVLQIIDAPRGRVVVAHSTYRKRNIYIYIIILYMGGANASF